MRLADKLEEARYRDALDDFELFLDGVKLPEDFSDWTILDWQIFALEYLKANWDHAVEDIGVSDPGPREPSEFDLHGPEDTRDHGDE